MSSTYYSLIFFFKAEDGIRDSSVTGVQTCALPIWPSAAGPASALAAAREGRAVAGPAAEGHPLLPGSAQGGGGRPTGPRSEERRGGEECRSRWSPDQLKKIHTVSSFTYRAITLLSY